jgi:hypothetical protein
MTSSTSDSELDKKESSQTRSQLANILESKQEESDGASSRSGGGGGMHPTERLRSDTVPSSEQVNDILDKNLEDMGTYLSRLKGLGMDLNREIEDQNVMLDRIHRKTEDTDFKVQVQTKEMNRILKK